VRRRSKAPFVGSVAGNDRGSGPTTPARRLELFALASLALVAFAIPASPALAAGCANEQLRTESNSLALPECRGYELVSPPVKDFAFGLNGQQNGVAAANRDAFSFDTAGPMPGSTSGSLQNLNLARRTASGWVNRPFAPPQNPRAGMGQFPTVLGYSQDLSQFVFQTENPPLVPGVAENTINLYSGSTEANSYNLLTADAGAGLTVFASFAGGSEDSSRLFFEDPEPLLPGAPGAGTNQAYEWSNGQLRNVGILPDGTPAAAASVGQGASSYHRVKNAISPDGSRVVFMGVNSAGYFDVYQRVDATSTVYVSESKRTLPDPTGPAGATFWGASSNGGTVLFTSPKALTNDGTPREDGGVPVGNDLYRYEVATDTLTDLTVDDNPADAATGANVQGVIGNSDDGQYVYFVATGDLAAGASSGALNLYVAHGTAIKYIGALDSGDSAAWEQPQSVPGGNFGFTARVSASGDLAFQSTARLTSYDNASTRQAYRYSPADGLTCISCRPDGSPPVGNASITVADFEANLTRNISADGSRVFFDSSDAILPEDTNEKTDVYEWSGGQVHLISDGKSPFNSTFQDASANGDSVYFGTGARLVGQDTDSHVDVYVARTGGGFPAPPVTPPGCVGEACRTGTSTKAAAETAATASFQGPPNPKAQAKKQKKQSKKKSRSRKTCKSKPSKKCKSQAKQRSANKSGRGK